MLNSLQDTMYISPSGLDAHAIRPSNFQMAYRPPVALADVEQPVEDIVVVLGIKDDLVGAVEDGCGLSVNEFAESKNGGVCRRFAWTVAAVDKPLLS